MELMCTQQEYSSINDHQDQIEPECLLFKKEMYENENILENDN